MRTAILLILTVLITSTASSQATDPRNEIMPFQRISVFGNIELILKKGAKHDVDVLQNSDDIKIKVEDGKLKLSHRHNERTWSEPSTVTVTYVKLTSIDASAGAHVEHEGTLEASSLAVSADIGAEARFTVNAENIEAITGEGGVLTLKGVTGTLESKSTTGSVLKAGSLEAKHVYVRSNTGASATVNASELVEATAMMGGAINVIGDPETKRVNESMGGRVN